MKNYIGKLACVSRGKVEQNMGGQNQVVMPGSEKGARLGRAYVSETGIFGKQVPF